MHFTILGDWNSILHVNKCLAQSAPKMANKMINTKISKKKCQAWLQEVGVKSPPTISKLLSPLPIFAPPLFPSTLGSFPSPRKKTLPRLWPVLQVSRFLNFYLSNTGCANNHVIYRALPHKLFSILNKEWDNFSFQNMQRGWSLFEVIFESS